jgi:DNA-binding response OmpR family regulator
VNTEPGRNKTKKILPITKDSKLLNFLKKLDPHVYNITEAISAELGSDVYEIMDDVRRAAPDLIILDVMMPRPEIAMFVLYGLDNMFPEIPVLPLSTWDAPEDMVRGSDRKSLGHLTESFGINGPKGLLTQLQRIFW